MSTEVYSKKRITIAIRFDISDDCLLGADQDLLESSNEKHMFELVLAWARENVDPNKPRIEDLTEQVNLWYLIP